MHHRRASSDGQVSAAKLSQETGGDRAIGKVRATSAAAVPVWQAGPAAGVALLDRLVSELESALQAGLPAVPSASRPPLAPPLFSGRGPASAAAAASSSSAPPSEQIPVMAAVRLASKVMHLLLCVGGGLTVLQPRRNGGSNAGDQSGSGEEGRSDDNTAILLALGRLGLRAARAFAGLLKVGPHGILPPIRAAHVRVRRTNMQTLPRGPRGSSVL